MRHCMQRRHIVSPGHSRSMASPTRAPGPTDETYEWTNPRTGEIEDVPRGIDPGWNYSPGESWVQARSPEMVDELTPAVIPSTRLFGDDPIEPPSPRRMSRSLLLDEGLTEEQYAETFLRRFGADLQTPYTFTDVVGERLPVSDALFRNRRTGALKANKRGSRPVPRHSRRDPQRPG